MAILGEMTRTPSGYQQEAIRLRRDKMGRSGEPGSFDEAIVEGDALAAEKKWDDAVREYEAALEFDGKLPGRRKRKSRPREGRPRGDRPDQVLLARELFSRASFPNAWMRCNRGRKVWRRGRRPAASALAVTVLFNQFVNIPADDVEKKRAAMKQVIQAAQATAEQPARKPEAYKKNSSCSLQLQTPSSPCDTVNPKSERYPMALHLAGHGRLGSSI